MKLFVTGTDTDVGKTFVSCALLEAFSREGFSTSAMKPIASGCELHDEELKNSDALSLIEFSSKKLVYKTVNPWAFEPAIAPHIAAQEAGITLHLDELVKKTEAFFSIESEIKLIEGAGGWFVPINDKETFADFVSVLGIPVILVVSIKLGCINHAILSEQAIKQKGLILAGWIANISQAATGDKDRQKENIKTLQNFLEAPMLARIDYIGEDAGGYKDRIKLASNSFSAEVIRKISG